MQNERVCLWLGCSTVHFNIYVLNVRDKWCSKASSMPSPGRGGRCLDLLGIFLVLAQAVPVPGNTPGDKGKPGRLVTLLGRFPILRLRGPSAWWGRMALSK